MTFIAIAEQQWITISSLHFNVSFLRVIVRSLLQNFIIFERIQVLSSSWIQIFVVFKLDHLILGRISIITEVIFI